MKLTPVGSSHVAAIGYLEDERVLLIKYRTGALYARAGTTPAEYQSLMDAPSKGGYLAFLPKHAGAVLIAKGVMPTGETCRPAAAPAGNEAPPAGALNVIDEDASKCCRKAMIPDFDKGCDPAVRDEFVCPVCATLFRADWVGTVRHWRIVPLFALHRRGM